MFDVIEVGMFDLHKLHAQCVLIFIKSIKTQVAFEYSVPGFRHCKKNSFNIILVFNLYL